MSTSTTARAPAQEPIAIIGMSGRFPGAPSTDDFWRLLEDRREAVGTAPADRPWMHDLYDPQPRTPGRIPTDRGGFLADIDRFDASFFDIPPREAAHADPQLRLLLETAYETIENAGIPGDRIIRRPVGVFVGSCYSDYWLRHIAAPDELDIYTELGAGTRSAHSGRLAYVLGLRGPAVSVDTACSSSLTAVHLACQSLRTGECDTALAGGVNVILTPYTTLTFSWAGGISPDGSCKFADASADGFVRSEAVATVLLKPLRRALADGDRIRAVIRGSAVNNNGFSGLGVAAPEREGQRDALRRAYEGARVEPGDVDFVEAHGTGTPLGDSTELNALAEEMGDRRSGEPFLVASGKANIGHTESTAGIAGLIKAVLSLEHRQVPGNPHLVTPNPAVDWAAAPFRVPRDLARLPATGELLAGVNSLGASGTNVHVVLSSAPHGPQPLAEGPGPHLLPLSARAPGALRELAAAHRELLTADASLPLAEQCAAAARQRTHHQWRAAATGDSRAEMARALDDIARRDYGAEPEENPHVVFVFPGQGTQWQGMGGELLERGGAFRTTLERCARVIETETGWSLLDALRGEDASWQERTAYVQPALWAMGVALAEHWRSWGIAPDAVLGQSQGEIAAAHCAGALTLEQAGHLSCLRARLIDELAPPGAMAWLALPHTDVTDLLTETGIDAQVAVAESPASTVLSGTVEEIDRLVAACADRDLECRPIPVAYAAHSAQIAPVREPLLDAIAGLRPADGDVPFLSTVAGGELPGASLDADYWWRNLRETVLLEPVVAAQHDPHPPVFLQVSPHPVLTGAIRSSSPEETVVLESLRRGDPEARTLLDSLARLYEAGADVDWDALYPEGGRALILPAYPWQRERHWYQADDYPYPPIGGEPPEGPVIDLERDRFLLDHQVGGVPVMPGAGFLGILADAAGPAGELAEAAFHELLVLDASDPPEIRVRTEDGDTTADGGDEDNGEASEVENNAHRLVVESRTGTGWTRHATARAAPRTPARTDAAMAEQRAECPEDVRHRCPARLTGEDFYRTYSGDRNAWNGLFRSIEELWHGPGEVLARVTAHPADGHRLPLHPAVLDSCLQPLAVLLDADPGHGFVLASADRLRMPHETFDGDEVWAHARVTDSGPDGMSADITVSDAEGHPIVDITGLRALSLQSAAPRNASATQTPEEEQRREPDSQADVPHAKWAHALRWEPARVPEPTARSARYLLLGDGGQLVRRLTRTLTAAGHTVTVAPLTANPSEVLAEAAEDGPLDGVVCLYDGEAQEDVQGKDVQAEAVRLCTSVTTTLRALLNSPCRLLLVTRGTQRVRATDSCPAPWQAAVWGLGLVTGQEHPDLAPLLVDLDEHGAARDDADRLTELLPSATQENQLALRDGEFYAPRLSAAVPDDRSVRPLALVTEGGLDGLDLVPLTRTEPGPGEIEIVVTHAGLNFHDVLAAAGADGDATEGPPALGCESAGTVARIGDGVGAFAVGDSVIAFSYPSLRTHLTVPTHLVAHTPAGLSPAEAAALPAAHATAYHALVERARLAPGERVLIHSATGGVGQAAISIARMRGATVYATAGTPAKRELLERLGAEKIADSRSTAFADEFSDGVDVVLGTLVGEGTDAGFGVLRPFGRYVDLAVNDIAAGRPLPMSVFADCRSYLPVNVLDLYRYRPEHLGDLVRTVADLVGDGTLEAPTVRVFPADQAADACDLMAKAGHIGKVVLAMPRKSEEPVEIRPDASYLVTGGLSGVGGLLAAWLVDQGATHLLLTGRSDLAQLPSDDRRAALLEELRAGGTEVEYAAVDAADQEAMSELLNQRDREGLPPMAGVAHAAAVLTPGPTADLDADALDATLRPKVAGGWALHRLFADRPLDFFVLFSSAVSVLGGLTIGQQLGAYAAANAFIDALAAHRLAAGLPATVVNWGYWAEVGIAARLSEANGHEVRPEGMDPIRPEDAPALFPRMLRTTGRWLLFPPVDWDRYLAAYPPDVDNPLLYVSESGPDGTPAGTESDRAPAPPPEPRRARGTGLRTGTAARQDAPQTTPDMPPAPKASGSPRSPHGATETQPPPDGGETYRAPKGPHEQRTASRATRAAAEKDDTAGGPDRRPATASRSHPDVPGSSQKPGTRAPARDRDRPPAARTQEQPSAQRPGRAHDERDASPTAADSEDTSNAEGTAAPGSDTADVEEQLVTHLAAVLGTPASRIDRARPMNRLGMDSLMATDLRTRMRRDHGLDIPVARLLGTRSLHALAVELTGGEER
ncbi:beta-ketoacyl synthase N-terminal-like domain-containing protein [Streptomyces sp. NPDC059788]|uniref:beta-ketoacyl synthase N-terminal-like domain-containing protein n=1 Tax=Streptomyces sp. NPDC059788 TaxID=3346948 RepID=UPI0036563AF0